MSAYPPYSPPLIGGQPVELRLRDRMQQHLARLGLPYHAFPPRYVRNAMTRRERRNAHTRMHSDTTYQCVRCRTSTLCPAGERLLSDGHQPDNAKQYDADIHHANRHRADYNHHHVWSRARLLGADLRLRVTGYPCDAGCGEAPDCGA